MNFELDNHVFMWYITKVINFYTKPLLEEEYSKGVKITKWVVKGKNTVQPTATLRNVPKIYLVTNPLKRNKTFSCTCQLMLKLGKGTELHM